MARVFVVAREALAVEVSFQYMNWSEVTYDRAPLGERLGELSKLATRRRSWTTSSWQHRK